MRSITFHPASIAIGIILGVISFVSMGQASTISLSALGSIVRVEYLPHPRDMVQIRGGTPYVVPPGKLFVLSALGNTDGAAGGSQLIGLLVNGQREVVASGNSSPSITPVPTGLTVPGGATVELVEVSGSQELLKTRAWGFLVSL